MLFVLPVVSMMLVLSFTHKPYSSHVLQARSELSRTQQDLHSTQAACQRAEARAKSLEADAAAKDAKASQAAEKLASMERASRLSVGVGVDMSVESIQMTQARQLRS